MEENKNEVSQADNTVGNDQVGRDKITNYNFNSSQQNISALQILLTKFNEERNKDPRLDSFIEELDYYNKPFASDVIGLEQKLTDGNRENFIDYAIRVKESFRKKLDRYKWSESAQQINYHLLALVESYFMNKVYPRICNEEDPNTINDLIVAEIVNPLLSAQLAEEPLNYSAQEINGMLYFLTGNCHIKWTK